MAFSVPDQYRVRKGPMASDASAGNNGAFFIPRNKSTVPLKVIASDGLQWEHVSVSLPDRSPTWEEMCTIKNLFWDPEDVVIQYHPAHSDYINNHPYCLHLWRPVNQSLPVPDPLMVGSKNFKP